MFQTALLLFPFTVACIMISQLLLTFFLLCTLQAELLIITSITEGLVRGATPYRLAHSNGFNDGTLPEKKNVGM